MLIDACADLEIQKYIYISSAFVTRPETYVSYWMNILLGNSFQFKLDTENYLRKSGLNYVIIRPGGMGGKHEHAVLDEALLKSLPVEQIYLD